MTKEQIEKYITEICINCKNKNTNLCEIRQKIDNTIKCCYYEREGKTNEKNNKDYSKMFIDICNSNYSIR